MFLPATQQETVERGWDRLDVILVTGDAYIDAPSIGTAVIGKVLEAAGFRVGVIAQPDMSSVRDISRMGEPALFWGVTAGCVDSMVANRTASGRQRRLDDYTPGGQNIKRPDRATIVYSNLIRQAFKKTVPIVLGGIEASLRRVAHYDFWSDRVRRSILCDAKADYLLYGMAERSVVDLARSLKSGDDPTTIRGLCYMAAEKPSHAVVLPSFADVASNKVAFEDMFKTFSCHADPITAAPLAQRQDTRFWIQNPPAPTLTTPELDAVYALDFERDLHPRCQQQGTVKALETMRFSINTHRGCYGECRFCAIAVHQGRRVTWRSQSSILAEARQLTRHAQFKGTIHDVGGATANMYGIDCRRKATQGACSQKRCLVPDICSSLTVDHGPQLALLKALRALPGVRKVVVASGLRHDMVLADAAHGEFYLETLVRHHVSGQMKIAPEHSEPVVLQLMGKPDVRSLTVFRRRFEALTRKVGKPQFLSYYMIAAHPGCRMEDMRRLRSFALRELKLLPRQVQIFTPTPSTWSTLMYWTERDPFTGRSCFVEKTTKGREAQKNMIRGGQSK